MVPDNYNQINNLKNVITIFEKLNSIANEKREKILSSDWDCVHKISVEHQAVNEEFDKLMKKIELKNTKTDNNEVENLKQKIKTIIMDYKETETLNLKLLNDNMFTAKQKLEKIYNVLPADLTYSKNLKKKNELWDGRPLVFNGLI